MSTKEAITRHVCECPGKPICDLHGRLEWGGGEPDTCEPHFHGQDHDEQQARLEIARVLEPLSEEERGMVVRYLAWQQSIAEGREPQ